MATRQTVLITGGAGYIGSHIAYLMHSHGYKVIILDNLTHGNRFDHAWAEFIEGNCGDLSLLASIFTHNNIDAVIHCAAFIEVAQSVKDPASYYENNVMNSLMLLKSIVHHGIKKVIFSSSAAVYGIPSTHSIEETHKLDPINPYGFTKAIIERCLQDYAHAYDLKYIILRYFNVGGSLVSEGLGEMHTPESHLIPLLLHAVLDDKPFTIYGNDYPTPDGTCIRDYLHVLDVAEAHHRALEFIDCAKASSIFNLGMGDGYSVKEIVNVVSSLVGKQVPIIMGKRRPGDPARLVACADKASRDLGWKPAYTLGDIIKTAYDFEIMRRKKAIKGFQCAMC